jgi:hypothetical protein
MLKFQIKIKFRYIFSYIINIYIFLIKNTNLIVSWYYDTILRYDTANKKMILPSIPILKTLFASASAGRWVQTTNDRPTNTMSIFQNPEPPRRCLDFPLFSTSLKTSLHLASLLPCPWELLRRLWGEPRMDVLYRFDSGVAIVRIGRSKF